MLDHIILTDALDRADQPSLCLKLREELGTVRIAVCHVNLSAAGETTRVLTDPSQPAHAEVAVELGDLLESIHLLRAGHDRAEQRLTLEATLEQAHPYQHELEQLRQTVENANRRIRALVTELENAEEALARHATTPPTTTAEAPGAAPAHPDAAAAGGEEDPAAQPDQAAEQPADTREKPIDWEALNDPPA